MQYFLDSSAIVKRHLQEVGSAWVNQLADPVAGNRLWISRITDVEVIAAIARRARGGGVAPIDAQSAIGDFRVDLTWQYRIAEVSVGGLAAAMDLAERHGLRAYDAEQLAALLELNASRLTAGLPPLTMVSADQELNAAAVAEGQSVDDPNKHP